MAVSGLGGRESPLNENKRKKEKRERSQPQKRLKLFNPNFKSILEIRFLKNELR